MADLFAPKLRGDISYERPSITPQTSPRAAPTYFEGALKLGEFAVDAFSAYQKGQRRAASASGIDPNLAVFSQDAQTIEKVRQEQGQEAALLFERKVAKKYAAAGIDFGKEYQTVYETTTGRPWAGYGRDTQAYMFEEAIKRPEIQQNYWASYITLGPNATDQERLQFSIGEQAKLESSALTVAQIKSGQQLEFTLQGEAAYSTIINSWTNQTVGELNRRIKSGQVLGAQDIANAQAQWAQAKVSLSRPPGVSDADWKSTQDRIDNIDKMLETFAKASSNKVALEQLTTELLSFVEKEGGGTDIANAVTRAALLKDPTALADYTDVRDVMGNLAKASRGVFEVTRPNIFGSISDQATGGAPSGNTIVPEYSEEITSQFKDMTPQQTLNNLRAGNTLSMMVTPNSLNRQESREQFESAAYGIGLSLSQGGDDNFYSASFLKNLIGNAGFIGNVNMFAQLDPEGGITVRSTLLTGLNAEGLRQGKNLASIERSVSGAEWDGTKYVVNPTGLEDRAVPSARRQAFLDSLNSNYGGDLVTAAKDGYKRMGEVQDVLSAGGFYNIPEALDRREAIRVVENARVGLQEVREGDEIGGIIQESFTEELPEQPSDRVLGIQEETPRLGEAGASEVEQPSAAEPVGDVILALGTNDYGNPEQAAENTRQLIRDVRARGGNPVIVPPNVNSEQFKAVADAIIAVANEEGATIEMAQYDPQDPLHMTMAEAKRISGKYAGARVVGDSNAVRIMGMKETDLTKTGAGTKAIREAFGKSNFGDGRSTPAEQPANQEPGAQPRVGVKLPQNIEPEFVNKAINIANRLGIKNPDDLFTVMSFETNYKMTSDIRNPRSGAVGLIQFTNIGIRGLGVTKDELARMDRIEQLDYVERYFQPYKGKMKNLGDVYMAVFAPVAVGKPDSYPLYKAPTQAYEQNREMDTDRDGIITRGDAIKKVSDHQSRIKL